jgi:putative RecB family exonuclease
MSTDTVFAPGGAPPVAGPPVPGPPVDDAGGVAEEPRYPSLSPSRAADFKSCPLLYRFRTIDRLPERPSPDQARGTLVHAVLERLFDLPAAERTAEAAADLVTPEWERLVADHEELAALFADPPAPADAGPGEPLPIDFPAPTAVPVAEPTAQEAPPAAPVGDMLPIAFPVADQAPAEGRMWRREDFLAAARALLDGYFAVEDPRRLEPAERESLVSALVEAPDDDGKLLIRGYIDRLDVSPEGALRVVDYKTGGAPREAFEARALFQLKFYALVLWRTRGVVPRVLRLLYLKDAEACDYSPDADELARFERTLLALWRAIEQATEAKEFRPKPSRLCGWCSHKALCPAYGGTPPPFPERPERPADPALADPALAAAGAVQDPGADE